MEKCGCLYNKAVHDCLGEYLQQTWMYCPICGTPRPTEEKVELPKKIGLNYCTVSDYSIRLDQLIDYLAQKPWEKV